MIKKSFGRDTINVQLFAKSSKINSFDYQYFKVVLNSDDGYVCNEGLEEIKRNDQDQYLFSKCFAGDPKST
jgi:hypothetical protein